MAKVIHGKEYDFDEALYQSKCPECESGLKWEAYFDADGTNYYAQCCNNKFAMLPKNVTIIIDEASSGY